MRWLSIDNNRDTADNRLVVAFRDVVTDAIGHDPPSFQNQKTEVARFGALLGHWGLVDVEGNLSRHKPPLKGAPWSSDFDYYRRSTPLPSRGLNVSALAISQDTVRHTSSPDDQPILATIVPIGQHLSVATATDCLSRQGDPVRSRCLTLVRELIGGASLKTTGRC